MTDIPRMCTIAETAKITGLPEHFIRQLCITGKIVVKKAGKKNFINLDRFIDYLNSPIAKAKIEDDNVKIRRIEVR